MAEEKKHPIIRLPRYQQVAIELAERIVEGRYQIGEKLHARSTLATQFQVSPETARKAISVLVDLDIMDVRHGSGAFVASKEKAQEYVAQFKDSQSIQSIREEMRTSIQQQKNELTHLETLLGQLTIQTKRTHNQLPFVPYELVLTKDAKNLEVSVNELNFWHKTGATIVAIQTEKELILSPGPYAKFSIGNTLYFVGSELIYQRVVNFFYGESL